MTRISRQKALSKIEGYLEKLNQMEKMSYQDGEELREEMNVSIRTFIPLAFEDGEKKVKDFDEYVNSYVVPVGREKSPKEEQEDYIGRVRDARKFLVAWKEELEMTEDTYQVIKDNLIDSKRVFIVHGHDEQAKLELENIITRLNLEPIILHRKPDKGRTIIEKFETESKSTDYAFVLLTPDDECLSSDEETGETRKIKRARQNVVLELGFFIGSLGREKVCPIYKKGVELPSDITGVLYKSYEKSVEELYGEIRKELATAGYQLPAY
jgi:predicted nucleotide-binding protein